MKLSIIIPHYNSIDSLLCLLNTIPQEENVEVIVVDDRSQMTDAQHHILCNLLERIGGMLYENGGKKGAGTCRNIGLAHARGEWILFADADDIFLDNMWDIVQKDFSSKADVIFYSPTSKYLSNNRMAERHRVYEKLIDDYCMEQSHENEIRLKYQFVVPWSKLIRRSFLEKNKIRFDEVLASNDVMFSTKCAYHMESFEVRKDTIYCVTCQRETLTTKKDFNIILARQDVLIDRYLYLEQRLTPEEMEYIHITGKGLLADLLLNRYDLKEIKEVYDKFKKNGIRLWSKEDLKDDIGKMIKKTKQFYQKKQNF